MDASTELARIHELETWRHKTQLVRWTVLVVTLAVVVWSVLVLKNSADDLVTKGQAQDEYVAALKTNLDHAVIPRLQSEASETISEIQPEITTAVQKLGPRVPDVTAVARQQLGILQTDLPQRGEKVLDKSLNSVINSQEQSIRQMYPDVTDAQMRTLVQNLTGEAHAQLVAANNELFAPHQQHLRSILANLRTIEKEEAPHVNKIPPSWDMAILLLDIIRNDIKTAEEQQQKIAPSGQQQPPGKKST